MPVIGMFESESLALVDGDPRAEGRAHTEFTLDLEPPAVALEDLARDREAEPGSLDRVRVRPTVETLADAGEV